MNEIITFKTICRGRITTFKTMHEALKRASSLEQLGYSVKVYKCVSTLLDSYDILYCIYASDNS